MIPEIYKRVQEALYRHGELIASPASVVVIVEAVVEYCAEIAEAYAKADAADEDGDCGRVPSEIVTKIREAGK